jgi:anti-sigma regulatory factor (Ser/Thr protein kinase)
MERYEFRPEKDLVRGIQLMRVAQLVFGSIEGSRGRGIASLVREIAKNVIDHAGGHGYLELSADGSGGAKIVVRDYGPGFDFDAMRPDGASTRADSVTNFGVGLGLIEDMAATPQLDVTLEREHLPDGVRYTITVPPERAT